MREKGFVPIIGELIVLIILMGAFYFVNRKVNNPPATEPTKSPQYLPTNKPSLKPSPSIIPESDLKTIIIAYKSQPSWNTYTDTIADFSIQYNNTPEGEYKLHFKPENIVEGQSVSFFSCNTPTSGIHSGKEICLSGFTITIKDNYQGGSRREWYKSTYHPDSFCKEIYFANVQIANSNALLSTDDCGSFGGTSVSIPKGNKMITLSTSGFSYHKDDHKFVLPSFFMSILSTFKFN